MLRRIILEHSGTDKGYFRRISSFLFRHSPSSLDYDESKQRSQYSTFMQAIEEVGVLTVESDCAEVLSDTRHADLRCVITIV